MIKYSIATQNDAEVVKKLINNMYGVEYEVRENSIIAQAIENKTEIYILAKDNDEYIGFSGASLNNEYYKDVITPDIAVIDYIYTLENKRDFTVAYKLITFLINALIKEGTKQAIMQVQTFNKQRFFHYALSDKNIIKATQGERNAQKYEDQILLIEDLTKVANMNMKDIMIKAHKYNIVEN